MEFTFKTYLQFEEVKSGVFAKKKVPYYDLSVSFIPTILERNMVIEDPFFKERVFIKYTNTSSYSANALYESGSLDNLKVTVFSNDKIVETRDFKYKVYSINRLEELYDQIENAVTRFTETAEFLNKYSESSN